MAVMTASQRQYLEERQLCVLGTGRQGGSPQLSMMTYLFDGEAFLISVTADRTKYWNTQPQRQPRVSLLVPDGGKQVIVGTSEILEGKPGNGAIMAIREHQGDPLPDGYDLERFGRRPGELGRRVLRVTPERVIGERSA